MTIGTLKSPNPRNRISISVIKSKFLSVSSMKFARHFESHWRETWRHTGRRTVPQISLETPSPAGADRLTFEGVWVILETKISCRLILKETNSCQEIPGEKNSYAEKIPFMAYNAGKKVQRFWGKILSRTKSPIPSPPVSYTHLTLPTKRIV